jgi:uncharacterized membrane protein
MSTMHRVGDRPVAGSVMARNRSAVDCMRLARPENHFLWVILLAGLLAVIVTPFGAGFDEETHLARIWEMSAGVLLPNGLLGEGEHYPRAFYDLSYRQYKNLTPVSREMWARQLEVRIDPADQMAYETRSVLFPLVYAPQAALMALLARVLDAPVSLTYYLLRASYLALYAALVFLAIRLIPTGKWLLTILALSPASIVLASTISPDSATLGAAMLLLAWVLKLSTREPSPLSRRQILLTLGLVILVSSMKIAVLFVGVLLLLRPRDFSSRRAWAAFAVAALTLVVVVFVVWTFRVAPDRVRPAIEALILWLARHVLAHPGEFAAAVWGNLLTQAGRYWQEMIGVSGYGYWKMPAFVYWLYPALVLAAWLSDGAGTTLDRRRRAILLGVGLAHTLGVMLVLYLTLSPVGSQAIVGIQGRYFIPGLPYLLLGLAPATPVIRRLELPMRIVSASIALVAALALGLVYHIVCGENYYTGGLCYLPKYKNWDPAAASTLTLGGDHRVTQDFEAVCNQLTEIRVWVADRGASPGESVVMELNDVDGGTALASKVVLRDDLTSGDWLRLEFPPVPDSDRRRFEVSLRPADKARPQSIAVGWTETDEYFEGRAAWDGDDLHGDLIFQYACRVGLESLRSR